MTTRNDPLIDISKLPLFEPSHVWLFPGSGCLPLSRREKTTSYSNAIDFYSGSSG
jgi:hypothetical protein